MLCSLAAGTTSVERAERGGRRLRPLPHVDGAAQRRPAAAPRRLRRLWRFGPPGRPRRLPQGQSQGKAQVPSALSILVSTRRPPLRPPPSFLGSPPTHEIVKLGGHDPRDREARGSWPTHGIAKFWGHHPPIGNPYSTDEGVPNRFWVVKLWGHDPRIGNFRDTRVDQDAEMKGE